MDANGLIDASSAILSFLSVLSSCPSLVFLKNRRNRMKLNMFMTIVAVVAGLFGLGFVFSPEQILSLYGAASDESANYMAQLFGAALLGIAVILWLCKDAEDSPVRQAILLGLFVAEGVGFVVALITQLGGGINALGWSTVIIYLLFALGFGYFRFMKSAA
jgi:hypothetical protein